MENDPWLAMACDGDIHPGMRGFLSKRLITLDEAVEVYEKELAIECKTETTAMAGGRSKHIL